MIFVFRSPTYPRRNSIIGVRLTFSTAVTQELGEGGGGHIIAKY